MAKSERKIVEIHSRRGRIQAGTDPFDVALGLEAWRRTEVIFTADERPSFLVWPMPRTRQAPEFKPPRKVA